MSGTPARRRSTAVVAVALAFGVTLFAGAAPASAAVKVGKGSTPITTGVTLNGVTLNGVTLNGVTLNGVTLNGESQNGVTLN